MTCRRAAIDKAGLAAVITAIIAIGAFLQSRDEAEAHVLAMRADLMSALREHIKARGWTQSKAAAELGITQPRVSALVKGVRRDFSADMLLLLAARGGLRPTLKLAA